MGILNSIGDALRAFGAGTEGKGDEFLANANLAKLVQDMPGDNLDQAQYLKGLAQYNPEMYGKMQLAQISNGRPSVLQINDAVQKALQAGDYDTANRIFALARSQAYGVDTYSPERNPYVPPSQNGSALQQFGIPPVANPMANQKPISNAVTSEQLPTIQPTVSPALDNRPIGKNSIAEQQAINAALKKRMETQGQKDVELTMNPKITQAEKDVELKMEPLITFQKAAQQAAAELDAKKKAEYEENKKISPAIADLFALNEDSPSGAYSGKVQWIRRLTPGTSKEEKAIELMQQARIDMAAPLAKQLGVNPTDKDFSASMDRIFDINATKEARGAQIKALANKIQRRQGQLSSEETPILPPTLPDPETKTIGGVTYINQNGKWYAK